VPSAGHLYDPAQFACHAAKLVRSRQALDLGGISTALGLTSQNT
jgi:hypothetical protein